MYDIIIYTAMIMQTLTYNNVHTFSSVYTDYRVIKIVRIIKINDKIRCGYYVVM